MITLELKDKVLNDLAKVDAIRFSIDVHEWASDMQCSTPVLDAILSQFERLNFCSIKRCLGGRVDIVLNAEIYDMVRLGGFTAQDELLKKNIEKLLLELESLKSNFPERAERIATIIGGISSALAMFMK